MLGDDDILKATAGSCHVAAISLAPTLALQELESLGAPSSVNRGRKNLVLRYEHGRALICFDFGTIVFFGMDQAARDAIIEEFSNISPVVDELPSYEESLEIRIDPEVPLPGKVGFHDICLPHLSLASAEVIARLLAQSAAVERYEVELDKQLAELAAMTQTMATRGRILAKEREVLRLTARSIATNNRVFGTLALLDKPDHAWESPFIDHLHEELRRQLELGDRFSALEHKLRAIHDTVTIILDTMQTRRALFLEVTIVVLIAVEIVMAFF